MALEDIVGPTRSPSAPATTRRATSRSRRRTRRRTNGDGGARPERRARQRGTGGLQVADRASVHGRRCTLDDGTEIELDHGHVVIAAITSCTNTSNPSVMLGAGLLARNAVERGLRPSRG